MTQDEIINAYQTLVSFTKGDPYFLDALNRLRQAAMEYSENKVQIKKIKKKRLSNIKTLTCPKNVEIKIVETWDENDFARALTLGHFSDRGF